MTANELSQCIWHQRTAMLRLAMSMLRHPQNAEDAVSSAIVTAYQKAHTLREDASAPKWLMAITANACRDWLRRSRRITLSPDAGNDVSVLFDFDGDAVYPLILRLPSAMAQVITLYYYENYDTAEIARVLRIPSATVRARLSRARKQLRAMLEEEGME